MQNVIKASRNFICVRMMTYESASEAQFLKTLWRPDAPLENTIFAILDPDGRSIVRGGRSPQMVFQDADEMASHMNEIARYYGSNGSSVPKELPTVDTVRLAVDVAACDKRPLVIVVGQNDEERKQLAKRLAPTAWSEQLIGKLVYTTGSEADLSTIKNAGHSSGYVFVAPGLFGTDGTAIMQLAANASQTELASASKQALSLYRPQVLSHHDHVRAGRQNGIEWQTAIPVTDPHSPNAQQGGTHQGGYPQGRWQGHSPAGSNPNGQTEGGPPGGGPPGSGPPDGPPGFRPPGFRPGGLQIGGHPGGSFNVGNTGVQYGTPRTRRQMYVREYR